MTSVNILDPKTAPLEVLELPVGSLIPGFDFRLDDNTDDLAELAASIAEHGVLQPLLVCPMNDEQYEVVAGRRRLAASRQAGRDTVPCVVRDLDRDERTDAAIAENIHRRNRSSDPQDRGEKVNEWKATATKPRSASTEPSGGSTMPSPATRTRPSASRPRVACCSSPSSRSRPPTTTSEHQALRLAEASRW